ncbi:phage tail tube protein [Weissella tructae]
MGFDKARDTIATNNGTVIATINGKNRKIGEIIKLESKAELNVEEVRVLGKRTVGHKPTSMELTGSLSMYLVSSDWLEMNEQWKNGGSEPEISITTTIEDSSSSAKKQVVQLIDVIFEETLIANQDAEDGLIEFETDFKFDDYKVIQKFNG